MKIKEFGVHRSSHRILMYLSRKDTPTSQKDIAREFDISAAAVAVSIKKLESEGFILRYCDKNDSRTNIIELTEKGQDVVDKTKNIISELDAAMFENFTDEEIAGFSDYLSRLCDNISAYSDSQL